MNKKAIGTVFIFSLVLYTHIVAMEEYNNYQNLKQLSEDEKHKLDIEDLFLMSISRKHESLEKDQPPSNKKTKKTEKSTDTKNSKN